MNLRSSERRRLTEGGRRSATRDRRRAPEAAVAMLDDLRPVGGRRSHRPSKRSGGAVVDPPKAGDARIVEVVDPPKAGDRKIVDVVDPPMDGDGTLHASWDPHVVDRLGTSCAAVVAGLETWAKRTREEQIKGRTLAVAVEYRALAMDVARVTRVSVAPHANEVHEPGPRFRGRTRTGDRLRWEWLASTAELLDGAPDTRLKLECLRFAREACTAARRLEGNGGGIKHVSLALERARATVARLL